MNNLAKGIAERKVSQFSLNINFVLMLCTLEFEDKPSLSFG